MKLINRYRDVKENKKSFRNLARNLSLDFLSLIELKNGHLLKKNRVQFLYFHHIFEDELSRLEELLYFLSRNHNFISYSEAIERIHNNKVDAPYLTFSSDDGFKNNLNGLKLFKEYGIKCCFFLNSAVIELSHGEKLKEYCKMKLDMPPVEFLTWKDVEKLQENGHEIGSHSLQHNNLGELPINEAEEEIIKSKEILEKYCGDISHFAFPYGTIADFSNAALMATFEAGYNSCASAIRGCHINSPKILKKEEFIIRRDQIVFDWNLRHITYFMINNSKSVSYTNNLNPYKLN